MSSTLVQIVLTSCVLVAVFVFIRTLESLKIFSALFNIIPSLVFYYFLPTILSQFGLLPRSSPLYTWIKQYVLPASLILLTLSLDLPALRRLGWKTLLIFLISSVSIMIGGPIALAIWKSRVPVDGWKALAYLAGSWIGGAVNAVALVRKVHATDAAIGPVVLIDVLISYTWMAVLLVLAGRHATLDRWLRADRSALAALKDRIAGSANRRTHRVSIETGLLLAALALALAALCNILGRGLGANRLLAPVSAFLSLDATAWGIIVATTLGVILSMSPARKLESAGASKVGMLLLYLLIMVIGAGADFSALRNAGGYLGLGITWMVIHIAILFLAGRLLRAPFFLLAVSSQANIGGPVSAPIVAAAFNPALAPVGVILAIAGYVLGTYAGLVCTRLCEAVSG